MGLLDKLKSLFGSKQKRQSPARENAADVTVEHEPAAESEHAVKGTDTGRQQRGATQSQDQQPAGHAESQTTAGTTTEPTGETEPEEPTSTPEETAESPTEDTGGEAVDTATDEESAESPSVEEIKGIGPTYAERLEAAGMGTVADLAAADPADVAEAAQTGENRAGDWVERAQDF
jgi:predicted flap endonuclease-1-like 5' DNA nuclease